MNLTPRYRQVLVDIGRQRLERRDVNDAHFVRQATGLDALAQELVERGQEGSKRLPGARGCRDQRIFAATDRAPAVELRVSGFGKPGGPPLAEDRVKIGG